MFKKIMLFSLLPLLLLGCVSPAAQMGEAEIRQLSDDSLCAYTNNYRAEPRTAAEIKRRNLNCDRFYRQCLARGNKGGTDAMDFCIDTLRENERLTRDKTADQFDQFSPNRLRPQGLTP